MVRSHEKSHPKTTMFFQVKKRESLKQVSRIYVGTDDESETYMVTVPNHHFFADTGDFIKVSADGTEHVVNGVVLSGTVVACDVNSFLVSCGGMLCRLPLQLHEAHVDRTIRLTVERSNGEDAMRVEAQSSTTKRTRKASTAAPSRRSRRLNN